ncbi:hypothetical protein MKZ38_007514 [Zalerion maritima]|uniref:Uncharacterized protein n=1 Tax=Zalerion maritima TaxID=339359 RepID=A0AAD5RIG4_9PEZI|nr:hypothetical protein MKZ38_007514 [Zalerion maritima]
MAKSFSSTKSSSSNSGDAGPGRPWHPNRWYRLPIPIFITIAGGVILCILAFVVFFVANGQLVNSWPIAPSVFLSLIATFTALFIRSTYRFGADVFWWSRLLSPRGVGLTELHEHHHRCRVRPNLRVGNSFGRRHQEPNLEHAARSGERRRRTICTEMRDNRIHQHARVPRLPHIQDVLSAPRVAQSPRLVAGRQPANDRLPQLPSKTPSPSRGAPFPPRSSASPSRSPTAPPYPSSGKTRTARQGKEIAESEAANSFVRYGARGGVELWGGGKGGKKGAKAGAQEKGVMITSKDADSDSGVRHRLGIERPELISTPERERVYCWRFMVQEEEGGVSIARGILTQEKKASFGIIRDDHKWQ